VMLLVHPDEERLKTMQVSTKKSAAGFTFEFMA